MSRKAAYAFVLFLIIGLIGVSYWAVHGFTPWLIRDIEEMSLEQLDVTKQYLTGHGIELSTDRTEYAPGDTVLLTMTNHTRMKLEHQPEGFHQKMLTFWIDVLRAQSNQEAFSIAPGDSRTVALVIPKTADPKQYAVQAQYRHLDWVPAGNDLIVSAPEKQIKVVGPPPLPVPREGWVEIINDHKAEVYLGEKTYVEAVMASAPLELRFHLPEGVGYAQIEGTGLNSYENHAEYLQFKTKDDQRWSGYNVPPEIPARVSFEMDLDRDAADSYGLVMQYQDWVGDKKPLHFKMMIEMNVVY
ncbi:MAG: hypothetical protein IBX71_01545 [Candidatus Desulforudis sp.]|nr:hypothetical protein [Desulforudis sp.]